MFNEQEDRQKMSLSGYSIGDINWRTLNEDSIWCLMFVPQEGGMS